MGKIMHISSQGKSRSHVDARASHKPLDFSQCRIIGLSTILLDARLGQEAGKATLIDTSPASGHSVPNIFFKRLGQTQDYRNLCNLVPKSVSMEAEHLQTEHHKPPKFLVATPNSAIRNLHRQGQIWAALRQ